MKNFLEKSINILPHFVLLVLVGVIVSFFVKNDFKYEELLGLIRVFIWPSVVLLAFMFFKKVFTYLFFSMEEFNFFGNKGTLKDVKDVINERVKRGIEEEKEREERINFINNYKKDLEDASSSKDRAFKLAERVVKQYEKLQEKNNILQKQLSAFILEKEQREARHAAIRRRIAEDRQKQNDSLDED